MTNKLPILVLIILFTLPTGWVKSNEVTPHNISIIASAEQIKQIDTNKLLFIDVRNRDDYLKAHINQAIHIDVEDTFNKSGDPTRIAPLHQTQTFLSKVGVKNSDYIIIYDNGDLKNAAHLFWLLDSYSHKRLTVLDGGFPEWVRQNGKISHEIHTRVESQYIPSISPQSLSTKLSTRIAIENSNTILLDSRTRDEYLGLQSKAKRFGHIPTAVSIPWSDNFLGEGARGVLKSKGKLEKLYESINKEKEIVAYCNRGKQSSVTYLILRNMGFTVSVYDGGWLEWGNDPDLPVTRGVKKGKDGTD